jgi:2'-5' RNA ligase
MSPFPTEMVNHWWQRPGRYPGRELYHWHMLFHDQPRVRQLAAMAQERLVGIPGLDMVPMEWLHLTTYIVGFADELSESSVEIMICEARRLLGDVAPITVRLGRVHYHPTAVVLPVEPLRALDPALDAVKAATHFAGLEGHSDTDPWLPHVSVAYPNRPGPAAPIIAALGRRLPEAEVTIRSVSLVSQTQVGRTWQWRPVAEATLTGRDVEPDRSS